MKTVAEGQQARARETARRRHVPVGERVTRSLLYGTLVGGAALLMFPLYWLVTSSVKSLDEINTFPPLWIPSHLAWSNYPTLFQTVPFWSYLQNSLFVTLTSVAGTTFSSALVGYSFARLRFPGRNVLFVVALSTLMVPGWVTLIPQFIMFRTFGWLDTFSPLIVPQLFANASYLFLMRQFFMTLPIEMEDAAKIDGCGHFRTFWSIALPLVRPALIAVATFSFLSNWNDFLAPLIYLQSPEHFTLPLGLAQLQSQYFTHTELIMVGSVLTVLPCIVLFFVCQRWFIQGIVITGVKG